MCGRFTLKTPPSEWGQLLLPLIDSEKLRDTWQPRYNIAPTQNILAVARYPDRDSVELDYFRWGLVPNWAKDLSIGNRMINARAETLSEKRSFSGPLKSRRCMIIADGYFEWQKMPDGKKQPCWISPADGGVVRLAGLWEQNRRATDQRIQSCTIITTGASDSLAHIHDRMPVALSDASAEQWMNPGIGTDQAQAMLKPAENSFFSVTRVGTCVNNPRNEVPDCLAEVH